MYLLVLSTDEILICLILSLSCGLDSHFILSLLSFLFCFFLLYLCLCLFICLMIIIIIIFWVINGSLWFDSRTFLHIGSHMYMK